MWITISHGCSAICRLQSTNSVRKLSFFSLQKAFWINSSLNFDFKPCLHEMSLKLWWSRRCVPRVCASALCEQAVMLFIVFMFSMELWRCPLGSVISQPRYAAWSLNIRHMQTKELTVRAESSGVAQAAVMQPHINYPCWAADVESDQLTSWYTFFLQIPKREVLIKLKKMFDLVLK